MDTSKFKGFLEWFSEVMTQDNLATQVPIIYELQVPRRVYTINSVGGSDCGEGLARDVLGIGDCEDYGVDPEEELYWTTVWEGRQWFFTKSGYDQHMELNGHNYRNCPPGLSPRPYVHSLGYRNPEAVQLFSWLSELQKEIVGNKGRPESRSGREAELEALLRRAMPNVSSMENRDLYQAIDEVLGPEKAKP